MTKIQGIEALLKHIWKQKVMTSKTTTKAMDISFAIAILFAIIAVGSPQNVTRPTSTSSDRDFFQSSTCNWQACQKKASACHANMCCTCMCNTGTSYMSLNKSCIAEKQIAKGCNFMAQTSSTAPWSFKQISVAKVSELVSGIHLFHCTLSSCIKATDCKVMNLQYESNGWQKFPSSSSGALFISQNLLKLSGNKCYQDIYKGQLLSATLQCTVKGSTPSTKSSCIIFKVSGNYKVGTISDASELCRRNATLSTYSIKPTKSRMPASSFSSTALRFSTSTTHSTHTNSASGTSSTAIISMMSTPHINTMTTSALSSGIKIPNKSSMKFLHSALSSSSSSRAPISTNTFLSPYHLSTTAQLLLKPDMYTTTRYYTNVTSKYDVIVTSKFDIMKTSVSNMSLTTKSRISIQMSMTTLHFLPRDASDKGTMSFRTQTQEIKSVSPSMTIIANQIPMQSSIVTTLPFRPTTNVPDGNEEFNFVLYSTLAGGAALFILLVLGIFLIAVIIRRKRLKIKRNRRKVIIRKFSDGLATFKKRPFHGTPPGRPVPSPSIIQLGSIHRQGRQENFDIHMGTSDRLNLAYSWNSRQEEDYDDDDYDIPADPPGIERSFSALYAKVDKSRRRFVVDPDEDHTSTSGNTSPKTENSRISIDNVYDEPGSMLGPGAENDVTEGQQVDIEDFEKYLRNVTENY